MATPESTRTLRLPRLTLNESRARTLMARHGQGLPLDLGAPWRVDLRLLPLAEAAMVRKGAWVLQLEWAGARFVLRLPEPGLARIVEALGEPGLQLASLPPELAADALEAAWDQVVAALAPLQRGTARLHRAVFDDTSVPELQHRLLLTLRQRDEVFHAELATDPLGLMLAAGALASRAPQGTLPALPLRCRLELGRTRLGATLLASLRRHDVVLFDKPALTRAADGSAVLWLSTGPRAGIRLRLNGTHAEVMDRWRTLTMSAAASETEPNADAAVDLGAVPVQLSFDLGELQVPLSELQQLVPGQAFDLGRVLAGAVRVRANGALIGSGELVEIDGRLGVALTQIASASGTLA